MQRTKIMKYNKPSPQTLDLLLEYEVGGGKDYYEKKLSRFTWPGGASGPTIGIGIDTAYSPTHSVQHPGYYRRLLPRPLYKSLRRVYSPYLRTRDRCRYNWHK